LGLGLGPTPTPTPTPTPRCYLPDVKILNNIKK